MESLVSALSPISTFYLGLLGSTFAGLLTGVGALPVLLIRNISGRVQNAMLGFGAGVMLAATAFSLVLPGVEAAQRQVGSLALAAFVVAFGILAGGVFLWTTNHYVASSEIEKGPYDAAARSSHRIWLFVLAITIHNFPEGLSVGVGFGIGDIASGVTLAIGIGLQNIPEGMVVAFALLSGGYRAGWAFLAGMASGLVEPVGGAIGAGIVAISASALPWGLAFAAGAMLFVINQEVVPEMHREKTESRNTFSLLLGFVVMMMLDIVLG